MAQNTPTVDIVALLRQRLVEMPLIVLSKPLDASNQTLHVQDYVIDGETVIPLFSSVEKLKQSSGGATLGQGMAQISRALLAQVSKGHEIYLLDPKLAGEVRFTVEDLRLAFPSVSNPNPV